MGVRFPMQSRISCGTANVATLTTMTTAAAGSSTTVHFFSVLFLLRRGAEGQGNMIRLLWASYRVGTQNVPQEME